MTSNSLLAHPWKVAAAVAAVLTMALAAVLIPATQASAAPGHFSDVPTDHQFYTEVMWLADQRVTTGYSDGTFKPKQSVSREAFAAFLYRLDGSPSVTLPSKSPFKDVPTNSQFYREIVWLSQSGITTGWSDGTFRPKASISREAIAAFLYRFEGRPTFNPPNKSPFNDMTTSAQFYKEVTWLANTGMTTGFSDGSFRPRQNVSREAVSAFLYRGNAIARSATKFVYEVGSEIPPGVYTMVPGRSSAQGINFWDDGSAGCLWQRRSNDDIPDDPEEIDDGLLTFDFATYRSIVEILPSDTHFLKYGCSGMTPLRAVSPNATSFGVGDHAVGFHMRPGTYRAPGGSQCDWIKASDFTWDPITYLDWSEEAPTNPQVQLSTGQAFFSIGCGTWTRIGN